ncbi:MAG: hypothetical protein ABIQ43_08765 [Sphingomonas sp.]
MRLRATTIYADAWAAWRRDWTVLTAVAGMFVFLPQLALLLLIPNPPDVATVTSADPNDPTFQAWSAAFQGWVASYGWWYIVVVVAALYGQFALVATYLTRGATVGRALVEALRLLPRLALAWIIWMLPFGLLGLILIRFPFLIMPALALMLSRTLLVAPAIIAGRPIGAVAAIGRSFTLTRGHMLLLAGVVLSVVLAQYLLAIPFLALDQWMANNAPNPIARAMVDAITAAAAALGSTAMALVQVAAWRRLSPSSS